MLQFVGKLRVRLSCLQPNHSLSADLPLLGERSKGAQVVGAVQLTLQASYASLVRGGGGAVSESGRVGGTCIP